MNGESRMLIGGKLVGARSGATFENVNPATEEVLGVVADAGLEDADAALAAARRAFDESRWAVDRQLRKRCLEQLHDALSAERELVRAEIVAEVGTPVGITPGLHVDAGLDEFRWVPGFMEEFGWERELAPNGRPGLAELAPSREGADRRRRRDRAVERAARVLADEARAGARDRQHGDPQARARHAVERHPDRPPRRRADRPPAGRAPGADDRRQRGVAESLVTDPRSDMVSFTGSTAIGRRLMAAAAGGLKRVFLELGGKSAHVVLDDADFEQCLAASAMAACRHAGQSCATLTRVLLPRSRYDEGVAIIEQRFAQIRYGDPTDPEVVQGPQINARQRERVLGYIELGVQAGARLVCGGRRPLDLRRGFYIEPTLFADVDNSMEIAREEIFGPVLVVIPFEDDDDAVRIANDTPYGLSSAVSGGSEERALSVARRLRAGTVSINGGVWLAPDSPFGGYKSSGIGRQNGIEGFEQYTETKTMAAPLAA